MHTAKLSSYSEFHEFSLTRWGFQQAADPSVLWPFLSPVTWTHSFKWQTEKDSSPTHSSHIICINLSLKCGADLKNRQQMSRRQTVSYVFSAWQWREGGLRTNWENKTKNSHSARWDFHTPSTKQDLAGTNANSLFFPSSYFENFKTGRVLSLYFILETFKISLKCLNSKF